MEETFGQAWDRFKGLLRATPVHGFDKASYLLAFLGGGKRRLEEETIEISSSEDEEEERMSNTHKRSERKKSEREKEKEDIKESLRKILKEAPLNPITSSQTLEGDDKIKYYLESEVYTIDPRNIEHILKTNFDKYSKGKYNQDIVTDLFGEGIFAVDGDKWRQQRKLASYEFSTRVLRDFSCSVFRRNATKLVRIISELSHQGQVFDMQDMLMRCTLDSIFKVGFGAELNCLEGSSKEGSKFMKAFDESNALIYWRYVVIV
ncbi:cytochrome P450 704C1-like [Vigna radiata var. radiata]|uniref:Cytochrome P450 704C1-like n=1 Tax=Vigna radiata var. radiata TaxID=3916 RepID=A0A3Q0F0H1_VIGRR|nr:cytochrome P450 704C1-like [Vigna radiata var. radiata]